MALTKITDKQVTYKQGGTGSVVRNLGERLRDSVSVKDFGAIGDDEFIPPTVKAVQQCWTRLDELEKRLSALEAK